MVASSCKQLVLHAKFWADKKLIIEMWLNESNVFEFIWTCRRQDCISDNPTLPWVGYGLDGWLEYLYSECVCFSFGCQPMNQCLSQSLVLYGGGPVAYMSIIPCRMTPTLTKIRTLFRRIRGVRLSSKAPVFSLCMTIFQSTSGGPAEVRLISSRVPSVWKCFDNIAIWLCGCHEFLFCRLTSYSNLAHNDGVGFPLYKRCDRIHEWAQCQRFHREHIGGCVGAEELRYVSAQGFVNDVLAEKVQQHVLHDVINDSMDSTFEPCGMTSENVTQRFFNKCR